MANYQENTQQNDVRQDRRSVDAVIDRDLLEGKDSEYIGCNRISGRKCKDQNTGKAYDLD